MRACPHFPDLMKKILLPGALALLAIFPRAQAGTPTVPATPPRAFILAGQRDAFRDFCLNGPDKAFYAQLKAEFDEKWLNAPLPPEPQEYGDPDPKKRTSDKVDKWRGGQVTCNQLAGTAEAAAILWLVTDDPKYLAKAKECLLEGCRWGMGASAHTRIEYNDEAHFRLWRKLPFVYDQIRDMLTPEEKAEVLAAFKKRGDDSFALVKKRTQKSLRNSIEEAASSHAIRFISMTGLAGLALYDDLPEAKEWFEYALGFYKNQFPPWGGDDGGWGEGNAYWRGNVEHSRFQDALVAISHPEAYSNPFWKQTGYFPLYFVQPYKHTVFGDTPLAGKFNLEPMVAYMDVGLARRFQDGYLLSYAKLQNTDERSLESQGLYFADERYPAGMEYILRNFATRNDPLPEARPLAELPPGRWFKDVGWVAMHSDLGKPADDIMLSFKSSPYGSFSHSHADQNSFILNAYGENLLINAGYREYHRSPHHTGYTQKTISKNALLVGGEGQEPQSRKAKGKILLYEAGPRTLWTAGDAAEAYNTGQPSAVVTEARRDVVMVDKRYFILRDRVRLKEPKAVSWMVHAESPIAWDAATETGLVRQPKAECAIALAAPDGTWQAEVTDQFPVPVDPKYTDKSPDQSHLTATSPEPKTEQVIYSVLWPSRPGETGQPLQAKLTAADTITVQRPDGKTDTLSLAGDKLVLK